MRVKVFTVSRIPNQCRRVKFTLEWAKKAQKRSRDSSTLSLNSALNGVGHPRQRDPEPIVHETGWDPGPVCTSAENLAPTGIFLLVFSILFCLSIVYLSILYPRVTYCSTDTTKPSLPPAGFEPAIPTIEQPQSLALDRYTWI
jgi:hypothetical protein